MAQNKSVKDYKDKKLGDNEQNVNEGNQVIAESQQNGVKKKLKTLTFCRRRKGINDVCQKRKSSWTFKFGPKIRDISKASVPLNNGESETCVCTVYRRTDQLTASDSLNFPEVDSLPKCVFNSKTGELNNEHLAYENFEASACNTIKTATLPSKETTESRNSFKEMVSSEENDHQSPSLNPHLELEGACALEIDPFNEGNPNYHREIIGADSFVESLSDEDKPQSNADLYVSDTQSEDEPKQIPEEYPGEDWDERARLQRAKEMEEGVEPPPGYKTKQITPPINPPPFPEHSISELAHYLQNHLRLKTNGNLALTIEEDKSTLSKNVLEFLQDLTFNGLFNPPIHTRVDYIHCLVPDLLEITSCSCYWGKMDRYEAERLLENKPEGTFLLRDSAQEDFLFSVSFQRYGKTLHARIEQWNHKFSFDSHDPGVFSSPTVCGLIEHYKDPSCCMYFDPMLTIPLHRTFAFSLQHLSRSVICNNMNYDKINSLNLPKSLKFYLKEYHYKQRVKVRRFDC